ncbi:MAG: cytochrome c biogenesis protein CcdA [Phycisphaerales bacterium]|jgi:thiol:disulfide interchange protein DsbD|nr:cytochrome c biogenesis protein CcdA [Phycisphaerales bacterium]
MIHPPRPFVGLPRLAALLLSIVCVVSARAQEVRASAAASAERVAPGDRFVIAVVLDHPPGLHSWPSADQDVLPENIAEFAIRTEVALVEPPAWLTPGPVQWPEPEPGKVPNPEGEGALTVPLYEGRAVALIPVRVGEGAPAGAAEFVVRAIYQSCNESVCFPPEEPEFRITVTIDPAAPAFDASSLTGDFAGFKGVWGATSVAGGGDQGSQESAQSDASNGDIDFNAFGVGFSLNPSSPAGFVQLMLVAALAGFLLNLMPCVLPMIPLKILGLTHHASSKRQALAYGIIMCVGVVAFWLAIGLAMSFISGFDAVSSLFRVWWFTLAIGAAIVAMGVGNLGLFTVNPPKWVYLINPRQDSAHGNFLFGVMTAVLATPCTAPFMATVIGWATQQSSIVILSTFLAVGLGMALPYLVLALNPKWVEKVPRSGPASELLKQVMAMLIIAAGLYFVGAGVIALVYEFPYIGPNLHLWAIALVAAAAGHHLTHTTFRLTKSAGKRAAFTILGIVIAAGGIGLAAKFTLIEKKIHDSRLASGEGAGHDAGLWRSYSDASFDAARAEGKVVVAEFTAAWCVSCKFLEASVLSTDPVVQRLSDERVVSFKVDLTSSRAEGWTRLRSLGVNGIPFLAVYAPGREEPVFTSNAYTVGQMTGAIDEALAVKEAQGLATGRPAPGTGAG